MKAQSNPQQAIPISNEREIIHTREGQIQIAKKISPVMCAIFEKIASAFDSHSRLDLPNGKALVYFSHDDISVIYRCGAQMKVSIPYEFIETIDEGTIERIDQMIGKWIFLFNDIDIPPQLWCDNPHYGAKSYVTEVPKKTVEILNSNPPKSTRGQRLVKKLLPPKISPDISEDTSERGVTKLRQTEQVRFPQLFIKKR